MYRVEKISTCGITEYLLTAGSSTAKVAPDFGALLTGFCVEGVERVYMAPGFYDGTGGKLRGGNPILFPACGRLVNFEYTLGDKTYPMEMHGFARNLPWQVVGTRCEDAAELILSLRATPETLEVFPFDFELIFTFRLKDNTLSIIQEVINNSDAEMPFSTGMHPYFCADSDKASVQVPSGKWYFGTESGSFDGTLDTREDLDHVCVDLHGTRATLDTGLGYRVHVDYEGKYTCVVVWSPEAHKNFVCVEPWSARPNALNTHENLIYLPGHSTEFFKMDFTIDEGVR